VDELLNIAERGPDVFVALMGRSWVNDGDITRDEAIVIDRIASTIRVEDQSLEREVMQKVIEILDMPFLDTVESPDALAMHSLEMFEDAGSAGFLELLRHPKLRDGINDEEAKTILLLGRANRHQPELVEPFWMGQAFSKRNAPSTSDTPARWCWQSSASTTRTAPTWTIWNMRYATMRIS
jgi:hypothetical protein